MLHLQEVDDENQDLKAVDVQVGRFFDVVEAEDPFDHHRQHRELRAVVLRSNVGEEVAEEFPIARYALSQNIDAEVGRLVLDKAQRIPPVNHGDLRSTVVQLSEEKHEGSEEVSILLGLAYVEARETCFARTCRLSEVYAAVQVSRSVDAKSAHLAFPLRSAHVHSAASPYFMLLATPLSYSRYDPPSEYSLEPKTASQSDTVRAP